MNPTSDDPSPDRGTPHPPAPVAALPPDRAGPGRAPFLPLALLLVALALPLYTWGLGSYPIRDAESKYAEVPREMLEGGDWLTPHLDYVRFLDKPFLSFWFTAAAYVVFGVNEFAARLPNCLAALAVALILGGIAATLLGRRAGWIAALSWLATGEVYAYTRDAGIEMMLLAATGLVVLGFLRGPMRRQRGWTLLMWGAGALGILTKGPVAVALPACSIALWCWATGRHPRRADWGLGGGAILLVSTVGTWFIAMVLQHPDFPWFFFVHENVYRLLGIRVPNDSLCPTGPWLANVAGEFFPWVFALPHALVRAAGALRPSRVPDGADAASGAGSRREVVLLGLSWAAVPLVVFACSRSKVDFYGLHVYPGLLLLIAWMWEEGLAAPARGGGPDHRALAAPWLFCAAGAAVSTVALAVERSLWTVLDLPGAPVVWSFLALALPGGAIAGWGCWTGRLRTGLLGVTLLGAGFCAAQGQEFTGLAETDSLAFAARVFRREASADARLVATERPEFAHVGTLPFYSGRKGFLLRDARGSGLYFSWKDPREAVIDESELASWVRAGRTVYLAGDAGELADRTARLGLAGDARARSGTRVLLRLRVR